MRGLWADVRLLMAETLLKWALCIAPRGHRDTARMARHLRAYVAETTEG